MSPQKFQLDSWIQFFSLSIPTDKLWSSHLGNDSNSKLETTRNNPSLPRPSMVQHFGIPCNNFNPSGDSGCTCRRKIWAMCFFHFCDLKVCLLRWRHIFDNSQRHPILSDRVVCGFLALRWGRPWKKKLQPLENKFKGFTPTNPWKKNLIPWKRNLSIQPEPGWRGVGGEGAAPPPQMHSQNMLRDSLAVHRIFGTSGPKHYTTTGPENHRTRGPEDQRTRGPQGQGSLNFFSRGCKYFFQGTYIFFPVSSP